MLSHGIIHASHVAGPLSSFDGVIKDIDVQVAKTREILSKKLSSFLSSTSSICNDYVILAILP
jgi:hypothetical protein